MPLQRSGSKAAFSRNVSAEMHAGKPQDQALAIAYSIKRRNRYLGGRLNRAEGGEAEYPSWMNADTLGPVSGSQDEMTRALPDYESRDPNELAMLRHREMVRPQAGRQDFPMEHLANMATAGLMFSPAGYALAPEVGVGRGLAAAFQHAPKLTTGAGLAGVGYLTGSDAQGAENQQASLPRDPKAIMELQSQLKAAGYPIEKIDGVINPGGPTERAFRQYQADQAARRAEDLKRQELETQQGANSATLATAKANEVTANAKLEADRLANEQAVARLARKKEADERLRNIDKDLSTTSRVMRDYSGPAGIALGALAGAGGRWLTQAKADKAIVDTAGAGNKIMAEDVAAGKKGVDAAMARATRANAFWRAGGAKEVPFLLEAEKAPGFAINPKTTPLNNTYSPQVHPAVEMAAAAPAGLEWGISNHYKNKWEAELADAEKSYSEDPSEINIQRINKAKDNVGLFTGLERFGQTAFGVQGVGAIGSRFMPKGPSMRPNMQSAEQEQGALQKIIRDAHEKAAKKASAAVPRKPLPILPSSPSLTLDAARARNGANIPNQAQGGAIRSPMDIAYAVRRQNRAEGGEVHAGPILSSVPGRTDNHPMDVTEGSYVLPADHVSSLGEGNTSAGMEVIQHMLGQMGGEGGSGQSGQPVPINAAGGEFVIAPEVVAAIGGGDIKRGHEMLDQWVLLNRKKHIRTLSKLPGPAKS